MHWSFILKDAPALWPMRAAVGWWLAVSCWRSLTSVSFNWRHFSSAQWRYFVAKPGYSSITNQWRYQQQCTVAACNPFFLLFKFAALFHRLTAAQTFAMRNVKSMIPRIVFDAKLLLSAPQCWSTAERICVKQ